jgi:hypothetical protein
LNAEQISNFNTVPLIGPGSGVVAGPAVVVIPKERRETSVAKHFIATSDRVPHVDGTRWSGLISVRLDLKFNQSYYRCQP